MGEVRPTVVPDSMQPQSVLTVGLILVHQVPELVKDGIELVIGIKLLLEADSIALATTASLGRGVIAIGLAAITGIAVMEIEMTPVSRPNRAILFFTIRTFS